MGERYGRLEWVLKDGISRVERNVEAQKLGYAVLALGDGQLGPGDLELTVWMVGRLVKEPDEEESLYQARTRICQKYVGNPALWERVEAAEGVPPQRPLGKNDVELEELHGGEAELYGGKGGSE